MWTRHGHHGRHVQEGLQDLELVTGPATDLVAIPELQTQVKLLAATDAELVELESFRQTAMAVLDGYSGLCGRALIQQTWALRLPAFPCGPIRLPLPPLLSVSEIAYVDTAGADQVLDPADYQVLDGEVAEVWPAYSRRWPTTRRQQRAVTVNYVCGWPAPAEDQPWPPKLALARSAVKLIVGDLFANRESQTVPDARAAIFVQNPTMQRIIGLLKPPRT